MSEKKEKCFCYFVDLERQSFLPTYPNEIKIMQFGVKSRVIGYD